MKPATILKRAILLISLLIAISILIFDSASARINESTNITFPNQIGTLWSPYLEWTLSNSSYSGNPFDLGASVTFTHSSSGETRTSQMFYNGNNTWKFRFAGTRIGNWSFVTESSDTDLNAHTGTVIINPNPNSPGFVTHFGDKWMRSGNNKAFVPQFVMVSGPQDYLNNPGRVDDEIQTFFVEHGFNGMHTPVFCRWFDINEPDCDQISGSSLNPDTQTFEALELMITKVYNAGGVVHIWMWGDNQRKQNPNYLPGGINGPVDLRLQRYIAARLGPLPGWTIGYGFDLFEWTDEPKLTAWHTYMQAHLGWTHLLGARSQKNQLTQLSEAMDFSSYEQHRPDYDMYVETIEARPQEPSFSEDRFRIRNEGNSKDYTMLLTRRGLWHSAMAGGIANIWGNLLGDTSANEGEGTSLPYPNPKWIRTYADFMNDRFFADMTRCNSLTNGVCLKRPNNTDYIFYVENADLIQIDLSSMLGTQTAVAVDTAAVYAEIALGQLSPTNQTWIAPYQSDWAIAVGAFTQPACAPTAFGLLDAPTIISDIQGEGLAHHIFLPLVANNYCPGS